MSTTSNRPIRRLTVASIDKGAEDMAFNSSESDINRENDIHQSPVYPGKQSYTAPVIPSLVGSVVQWRFVFRKFLWLYLYVFAFLAFILAICITTAIKYNGHPIEYSTLTGADIPWHIDVKKLNVTPFNSSFGDYNIILDGHSHSTYSDGKLNVETLLSFSIAQGFNALVVSDHNDLEGGLEAERIAKDKYPAGQLIVIPAIEYTCCRIHMNLLNINESIIPPRPYPTDDELRAAITRTHQLGGIAIVNHIPWSSTFQEGYELEPGTTGWRLPGQPTRNQLLDWGVDGFEVVNVDTLDLTSVQFAQQHNLITITGSDIHYPQGNNAWTLLKVGNGIVDTEKTITKNDIIAALLARNSTFIYDATATQQRIATFDKHRNHMYTFLSPLIGIGEYAQSQIYSFTQGMYSFVPTTVVDTANSLNRVPSTNVFCHESKIQVHVDQLFIFIFWIVMLVCFGLIVLGGEELRQRWAHWYWLRRGRAIDLNTPYSI